MSTIEELLATEVEEQWEVDPRYVVNELYMDDDGPVEITGRDIGDVSNQSSIQGEAISQYVEFIMPRYYDNIDLSTKSLSIHYEMDEAGSEVAPINVYKSQDHIKFGWLVPANATLKEGILSFGVWARGYVGGEEYVWKSRTSSYRIEKSLIIGSGIPQPDEDWYLQFVRQMDGKVSQASQFADDAKKSQEAAQQSANTSQQASESAIENSAKASQSATAAKTSEGNAKTSEENARVSEQNAKQSELEAKSYAELAEPVASTAQGLNPTLDNSTAAPFITFEGKGATEQQTYIGKNKLNTSGLVETTTNGITFTPVYENGMLQYVNVNGTATAQARLYFTSGLVFEEDTILSIQGATNGGVSGYYSGGNVFKEEKTVSAGTSYGTFFLFVTEGSTVNNVTVYPMIRPASIADDTYEPYVGGIASPNPDYPQEIHGVGKSGVLEVKTTGACIFGGLPFAQALNSASATSEIDTTNKTVTFDHFKTESIVLFDDFKENTQYTFICSGKTKYEDGQNTSLQIVYTDKTIDYPYFTTTSDTIIVVTRAGKTVSHLELNYGHGAITTLNYEKCGIFEGVITADEFEPYAETTANIPLSKPMYDGDYIRYNMDGTGEEYREYGMIVVDNNTALTQSSYDTHMFAVIIEDGKYPDSDWNTAGVKGYCSHYTNAGSYTGAIANKSGFGFGIKTGEAKTIVGFYTEYTTLADFKAWLAENPITVVYELAEPTVTPLTAEQIAEFEKLRTFNGITHITSEAECEVQYFYDSVSGKAVAMVVGMIKNK